MKKFALALLSASVVLATGCQSLTATSAKPVSATAVTQVFGDGQKLTGVIVDYDKAVKPSTIKAADFTVQDRTVLDVAKIADKQALISLDSNDANASLLVKQSNSNTGTGNSGGNGSRGVGQAGDKKESGPSVNPTNPTVTYSTQAGKQSLTISARDNLVVDDFVQRSYQDSATGKTVKYNLYIPKNHNPNKSYPLVLFMHDAGVTGSNVLSTLIQGNGATTWATPEFQAKHPAFVLAPQYDEIIADDNSNSSLYLDATINLIDNLDKEFNIDNNRLYATGQSGGAMTTIAMNIKHPELFAASWVVAGQWDAAKVAPMAKNKLFIIVSENDAKAFPGENAITAELAKHGAAIAISHGWDASANMNTLNANTKALVSKPANVYYATFKGGTLPAEKANATNPGSAHTGTWKAAYDIDAIKEWVFSQSQ